MKQIPIERLIIKGLMESICDRFLMSATQVRLISTTDKWKLVNLFANKEKSTVKYPMVFVSLESVTIKADSYNAKAMYRRGAYGTPNDGNISVPRYAIVPTDTVFEITMVTNNFIETMDWINNWVLNAAGNHLNFTQVYNGVHYDIKIEMARDVNVPKKESSIDLPSHYEMVSNLTVSGYTSSLYQVQDVAIKEQITRQGLAGVDANDIGNLVITTNWPT